MKNKFVHYPPRVFLGADDSDFTKQNKKQHGRSMIEMLGVLAIVGILSAGGIAGYSMAMQNHKTNTLIERVQLLVQQARVLYADGDYNGFAGADDLINAGLITTADNPFGGTIGIRTDNGRNIRVMIDRVLPPEACVKMLTTYWGNNGVFSGLGTTASVQTIQFTYEQGTYPVSAADATTACSGGTQRMTLFFR